MRYDERSGGLLPTPTTENHYNQNHKKFTTEQTIYCL